MIITKGWRILYFNLLNLVLKDAIVISTQHDNFDDSESKMLETIKKDITEILLRLLWITDDQ